MMISGARVLVTGASGGIGRSLVDVFARRDARLIVSSRHPLDGAASSDIKPDAVEPPPGVRSIAADLTNEADVRRLAHEAGDVDILVNNAGVGWYGDTAHMPCDDVRRLVEVNMIAPLLLTRLLLPGMVKRHRGHVVFIGSVAGHLGVENEAVYSATKAAVRTYGESLRAELRRTGVRVSVVSPGAVATDFFEHRGSHYQRSWPPAVSADVVATAVAHAIERSDNQVFVPHWLRLPALLHDGLPAVYRGLANKFG